MEYKKLGNSKKLINAGTTNKITCPKCNNKGEMSVFKNRDTRLVAKMPLVNTEFIYMIVCPKCASMFTVDNSKGKTLEKGEKLAIGDFDLKELDTIEY